MAKNSARRQEALNSIGELKAKRRKCYVKCALSLLVIVALVFGKALLTMEGVIGSDDTMASGILMMASLGLCVFAGTASMEATKCRHAIDGIKVRNGFSDEIVAGAKRGSN